MTTRALTLDEWRSDEWRAKLSGSEVGKALDSLGPRTIVMVVQDNAGAVIGSWAALHVLHGECFSVAPAHRGKAAVARKLLRAMANVAQHFEFTSIWTAAEDDDVARMVRRLGGVPVTAQSFVMPVKGF